MSHESSYPESEITQTNRQLIEAGVKVAMPTENDPDVIRRLREGYEFQILEEVDRGSKRNPI